MKKLNVSLMLCILIMLFVSVLISCSKDKNNCGIEPPSWIIGTWEDDFSGDLEWEFTSSNAILTASFSNIDFCESAESINGQNGQKAEINTLAKSNDKYSFEYFRDTGVGFSQQETYSFEKIDEQTIRYCSGDLPCGFGAVTLIRK